jgi:monoamine oxidase
VARTPLMTTFQDVVARVADEQFGKRRTRREFLRGAGAAGIGLTALGKLAQPARAAAGGPRIAIVGAGLAGLTCAYRFSQTKLARRATVEIYDANPSRLGGRCWSGRAGAPDNPFGKQVFEHGGELIDQNHTPIRYLVGELGLTLDNLLQAEAKGAETWGFFGGAPYSYEEMTRDIKTIWQQLHKDVSAAGYPTLYDTSTDRGRELDEMSIVDWIEMYVPDGMSSRLGQLLDVAYTIEYGGESAEQSALNMLYLLAYSGQGQLRIFGASNEKYHVRGGNDQIVDGMVEVLERRASFYLDHSLAAIAQTPAGRYELTFTSGARSKTVTADKLVLAVPFSILRKSIDFSRAGFEPLKVTAIRELGMGTNTKLHVQYRERFWNPAGSNGETFADTGYQNSWEVTRAQPGVEGILVEYTGGEIGSGVGKGTPTLQAQRFNTQLAPLYEALNGSTPATFWNGRVQREFWSANPYTLGSYSFWKVGQYTKFAGIEGKQQGNCHFCGEHTSVDFQGWLNGAVETGERVVSELVADLG